MFGTCLATGQTLIQTAARHADPVAAFSLLKGVPIAEVQPPVARAGRNEELGFITRIPALLGRPL